MKFKKLICVLKNVLIGVLAGLLEKILNALLKKLNVFEKRVSAFLKAHEDAADSVAP